MEEMKDYYCCQRGNENENVKTALFTAGMVLLLVCLKRALLFFLVEQWRAWVFLVLNIVLLAIFFTSVNPNSSQISHQETSKKNDGEDMKKKGGNCNEVEACNEDHQHLPKTQKRSKTAAEEKLEEEMVVEEEEEEEEENVEAPKMSKEELNERVEAFIAMFRQHLAVDARKERNKFYAERKQADLKKHMKFSSDGVNCFVLKVQG
ncbi:hypothetical protein DITRI_Ditri09bG0035300 [Diplodiscus trichospermus]